MGRIWTRIGLFFLGLLLCTSCTSRQSLYLKDFDALYDFYRLPHTGYFYILANKEKVMQGDSLEDLVHLRPDVMVEDGRRVVWIDDHFRRDPSIRKVLQLEGLGK